MRDFCFEKLGTETMSSFDFCEIGPTMNVICQSQLLSYSI